MFYFAYGSNTNIDQMAYRCPNAAALGTATLPGYELRLMGGVYTIVRKRGSTVIGALWHITATDLTNLDRYEGYPRLYDRKMIEVWTPWDHKLTVMTYIMCPERGHAAVLPSTGYIESCLDGYASFGMDDDPIYYSLDLVERAGKKLMKRRRRLRVPTTQTT